MFTMVRIKATLGKGKDFFLKHLSCNDYYSEKERIIGTWNGRLADMFGLSESNVDSETFSLFQQNINPKTHGKLTQRTVNGGIRFYDFQCSAQKSVSIMSIFGPSSVCEKAGIAGFPKKVSENFSGKEETGRILIYVIVLNL